MKSIKKHNALLNLLYGFLIFVGVFCVFFGSINLFYLQETTNANTQYLQNKLTQLQNNLAIAEEIYTDIFGREHEKTKQMIALAHEAGQADNFDKMNQLIQDLEILRKDRTFSQKANSRQQTILTRLILNKVKLENNLTDLQYWYRSYTGASRIFLGIHYFFPVDTTYIQMIS